MKTLISILLLGTLFSFTLKNSGDNERIIDLKIPSYTFSNWLEYEVTTLGEQKIGLSIVHESGKIMHKEERLLYGEAYLELDASDFPKGVYSISVKCKNMEITVKTEKI